MARIALAATIEAALDTLEHPIQQKGFSVRVEIAQAPVEVEADAGAKWSRLLVNLLTNALKFSGDSREIGVSLLLRDREAIVEVADLGIGIPAEGTAAAYSSDSSASLSPSIRPSLASASGSRWSKESSKRTMAAWKCATIRRRA